MNYYTVLKCMCKYQRFISTPVILGYTELPLLLSDKVSPVPCLDTMKLHIDALINMIVE